jgi:hypothetical protein
MCRWVPTRPPACASEDCGPPPEVATYICADGTVGGFTGRCERDAADAACRWVIRTCDPTTECGVDECGPAPRAPACTCADGTIGCNTGRCLRGADGMCGWEFRECPATTTCGGFGGARCPAGYFCQYTREAMCGAFDATGTCAVVPDATTCSAIDGGGRDLTVCGCDGTTYSSECHAWAAGTSTFSDGACPGPGGGADCDWRQVLCDSLPPTCPPGQVPTQSGACYGPCVPASECAPITCGGPDPTTGGTLGCPDGWTCDPASGLCQPPRGAADCDISDVPCDAPTPVCPRGQVPTQVGACYGPCVPVADCAPIACRADGTCPDASWTCDASTGVCAAP